jgi:hypothetical protein
MATKLRFLVAVLALVFAACDAAPIDPRAGITPLPIEECVVPEGATFFQETCPGFANCVACHWESGDPMTSAHEDSTVAACFVPGTTVLCAAHCSECY